VISTIKLIYLLQKEKERKRENRIIIAIQFRVFSELMHIYTIKYKVIKC
jgi:hypothetical protein